jgi:hypothetical protein
MGECKLSSASIAKQIDLEPRGEPVPGLLADWDEEFESMIEFIDLASFGHEIDLVGVDRLGKVAFDGMDDRLDFVDGSVVFGSYDKFKLEVMVSDELGDNLRLEACFFMALVPVPWRRVGRGGVGRFWANAHECTGNLSVDGTGRFDRDGGVGKFGGEGGNGLKEEGFAAGNDDVAVAEGVDLVFDFGEGQGGALGVPGGVGGIAPDATEVASTDTDEG